MVEKLRLADLRHRQALALLGGGNGNRRKAVAVYALRLGTGGPYRHERGDAEFACLFDEPVEAGALYGREEKPEIVLRLRRAQRMLDGECGAAAAGVAQTAKPLPSAFV